MRRVSQKAGRCRQPRRPCYPSPLLPHMWEAEHRRHVPASHRLGTRRDVGCEAFAHPVLLALWSAKGALGAGSSPCKREVGCTTSNDRGVLSGLEHMAYHPIALQSLSVPPLSGEEPAHCTDFPIPFTRFRFLVHVFSRRLASTTLTPRAQGCAAIKIGLVSPFPTRSPRGTVPGMAW